MPGLCNIVSARDDVARGKTKTLRQTAVSAGTARGPNLASTERFAPGL